MNDDYPRNATPPDITTLAILPHYLIDDHRLDAAQYHAAIHSLGGEPSISNAMIVFRSMLTGTVEHSLTTLSHPFQPRICLRALIGCFVPRSARFKG